MYPPNLLTDRQDAMAPLPRTLQREGFFISNTIDQIKKIKYSLNTNCSLNKSATKPLINLRKEVYHAE